MPPLTLLDIAKMQGVDAVVGLIDEVSRPVPEISGQVDGRTIPNLGSARTIRGTQYRTLVRTALPTVGFRSANAGVAASKSTYENRLVETFILNARWQADKAVADAHEDGAAAVIALEAAAATQAGLMALGTQFYYGRTAPGHAAGHPGLIDSVDAAMVVDAAGTTASTGSSVWGVKFGPRDVQWVYGQGGALAMGDVREESVVDPADSTKSYTAYVQELLAYPGVFVGSKYSCGRIKNLTADSGKGLTDARLYALLALFPTGWRPDCLLLSRRSLEQLRASRTATNATGAPAPTPTEFEGIPLVPTDSILNTETIA